VDLSPLHSLADQWTTEADVLRRRGAPRQAEALESAAAELEDQLREWWLETLTLQKAAEESGLSYGAVQKRVSRGELPNAGKEGAPRVRRCDLFDDPPGPELRTAEGEPDVAGEIMANR